MPGSAVLQKGVVLGFQNCSHEEADTRLVVHTFNALLNGAKNIEIVSGDTDVAIIFIGKCHELLIECQDANISVSMPSFRTFNINKIFEQLGENKCRALPMFHSLTGQNHI